MFLEHELAGPLPERAGELVTQEHQGREIYYRLETKHLRAVTDWVEKVQEIWEVNYKRLDALLAELKQAQKEERKK